MPDENLISSIVSTVGVVGALIWFLYYQTSVAMPRRDEHYTNTLKEIASGFTDALKEEREFRTRELGELKTMVAATRCHMLEK